MLFRSVSFHIRDGAAGQISVWDDFWPIFDNFHDLRGVLHSFTDTRLNLDKGFARHDDDSYCNHSQSAKINFLLFRHLPSPYAVDIIP